MDDKTYIENTVTKQNRIYVEDPDDAPDVANIQEGERGGYYYEAPHGVTEEQMHEVSDEMRDMVDSFAEEEEVADDEIERAVYDAFDDSDMNRPEADLVWNLIREVIEPELEERGVDVQQRG